MNEDLSDGVENLNKLDRGKIKLKMNKCPKFINLIMFALSIHVYWCLVIVGK